MTYVLILKYIGAIFSRNMHFHQTKKHNVEQARKAIKRIRNLNIPIDLQLYLFDHVILPIALYEIWGFEISNTVRFVHF